MLGIIRKMLSEKNELPEKTYLTKQMICLIISASRLKKSTRVPTIAYYTVEKNTKTWTSAPSVKLHGTRKGRQMRVLRPEEVP